MKRLIIFVGVLSVFWIPVKSAPYTDVVQTTSGPIRGEELTFEGTNYKSFKGIPYAAPPVGHLRFRAPEPPGKWTKVRDATRYGKICFQPGRTSPPETSEDCLTLSVFTPSLSQKDLKPVLFAIHGGGFYGGDGTDTICGPQYLMQHDIVLVAIFYRLGPIGFLATNSSDSTGNWGMKDQVAALRWVKENVRHFGGDSNNVTIYGQSAGGSSVHFHLFSPLSRGLFHKAIAVSGSALNVWPLNNADQKERYSRKLARLLGASETEIEDPVARVDFLRRADPKTMIDRMFDARDEKDDQNPMFLPIPFTPVIEPAGTKGAFLTEEPKKMLAEGRFTKVPLMMGVNDLEGSLAFEGLAKPFTRAAMRKTEQNVCQILPTPLKEAVIVKNGCPQVAQLLRNAYFKGNHFDSSLLKFVYLYGDLFMIRDVIYAQRLHARYSNESTRVYNHYFTFDGRWNLVKKLGNITFPGAAHGDELTYMFHPNWFHLPELPPSSNEVITKNRWTSFIANFVKYGNPTPTVSDLIPLKWECATENEPTTMVVGDDLRLDKEILKIRMNMWEKLYKKYLGPPGSMF